MLTQMEQDWNWQLLLGITRETLPPENLRMVLSLEKDSTMADGRVYLGMRRCPAAKKNHHAIEGGLVAHLLEMWDYFSVLKDHFRETGKQPTELEAVFLTQERIWAGILYHDLHKAYCDARFDNFGQLVRGDHVSSKMLRNDQKTAWILQNYGVKMDIIQANALYHSEGGWAESPPKHSSILAKVLYLLDELSGNVSARVSKGLPMFGDWGTSEAWGEECGLPPPIPGT